MNKFKRITAMFMVILTLFSSLSMMTVNAATEGTKTTIDASYRCYKGSDVGTSGTAPIGNKNYYWHYNADGTALNCPIRFLKEKGTGMAVYCIEVGAEFDGYTYDTMDLTDSPYWNSLSYTAQTGITYSTMYGYPVNNFGAANCDAYAATQTIIWEFAKGYRDLNGRTNAYYYNLMIKGSPAETAYNKLSAAIIAHNKRPSFAYSTASTAAKNEIELKFNAANNNWSATLTDTNGVLSGYEVTSNGGLNISKSGSTLTITANSELDETAQIELARPLPSTGQALLTLYSTSSQNTLIGQLQNPVTSYMTITTEDVCGKVSANKVNENGDKLSGVVFGIYADKACTDLITTMTTDNGTAVSDDINVSQYSTVYVKEKSMSDELASLYTLNPTVYTVQTISNSTAVVNNGTAVINEWCDGKVKVIKQNEAGKGLGGVVFGVYSDKACTELITKITTNDDGIGVSPGIDVGSTGSKTVYVKEVSITTEQQKLYSINGTVYPVTISAGKTVTANSGNPVINNWLPGKISVTKTNSAGEYLSGAEFTAYTDKECTEILKDTAGNAVVITTDKNGYAVSSDIYVGKSGVRTVYVKETALNNPDSDILDLNTTVFPVEVKPNAISPANEGNPIVNEYKPGKIMIVKENQNGNRLAGVTFSVYTDEACRNLLTTIVTDKNGVGISDEITIDGSGKRILYVKETALTDEQKSLYELSNTVYRVTIYPNQTVQANNGKTIINRWTLGQITLTKVNENGIPLNEITFAVYEDEECLTPLLGANGKQVMMTTDENGVATSEGIEVNSNGSRKLYVKEHCISEIHGDSYSLDDTVYPVVITAGTVAKVNDGKEIVNKWNPARVSLYKVNPAGDGVCGAEFTIYTDAECTTPLTDEDGDDVIVFTDSDGYGISNPIEVSEDGTLNVYLKETAVEDTKVTLNNNVFEVKLIAGEVTEANNGEVIVDDWKPGKLELYKLNENGDMLEGVTFGVYDDMDCTSAAMDASGKAIVLVTNKDGYATSDDIHINANGTRKLYVKEIGMTEKHQKLYSMNPTIFEIDLKPGETVSVNNGMGIVNEWLDATLSLVKQDEDGNLMSGVTFAVYEDAECTIPAPDISGTDVILVTDENGYAMSAPFEVSAHGNRIVFVKETGMTVSDSDIYGLNNEVWRVELSAGQNTEVNDGENIINCFKTAPVKIKKSDMTTAEGVSGANIQIFDNNGTMVYEGVTLEDGNTEEIELRVGKYTFVETIAPAGYVLNKTVFEFSVNPDRTVTGDCEVQDKPTEWTITKSDVTTAEPLAGAEITIYDAEGKKVYKDITKEDGTITAFYLSAGEYTFKETLAPEGYVINEEIFSFTIDAEGNVTGDNTVTDRKIKGSIKVIKTDEETGEKLAGAVFGLFSSDGKTKLAEGTTGEDGYVIFTDMEYGSYIIKELDAPVGFLMKKTEFEVNVEKDGETVELTVSNFREPVTNVPKTGDDSSSTPLVICFILMFMSAGTMAVLWLYKSGNAIVLKEKAQRWWRDRQYRCDRNGRYIVR